MDIYFSDKALCFIRQVVVGSLLLVCFTEITFAETSAKAPGNAADIKIIEDSGAELRLNVRKMLLREVLETIVRQTGIPIHYSLLPEGLVSANCNGETLKQILECLVAGKADLIVRYQPKENGLSRKREVSEVWIMGSNQKDIASEGTSGKIIIKDSSETEPLALKNDEVDADLTNQLLGMSKSKDASERAEAIAGLLSAGHKGDPDVKAALEQALSDDDALVRAQAISSLVSREGHAASAAIEQALHDKSVDVRMMAVDVVRDDVELLQQALYDSDQNVRDFAALKLAESGLKNGEQH